MSESKVCTKCENEKPLDEFGRRTPYKGRYKDGREYHCRDCRSLYNKLDYQENRDLRLKREKERRASNPEAFQRTKLKCRLKTQFGLPVSVYDTMLEQQNGMCAICNSGNHPNSVFDIDHNHTTGEIRGLLCRRCNRLLGQFKDDPNIIEEWSPLAATYLRKCDETQG